MTRSKTMRLRPSSIAAKPTSIASPAVPPQNLIRHFMLLWSVREAVEARGCAWFGDGSERSNVGFREHAELALECAALRHQVAILKRSRPRHRQFGPWDRLLWVFLSRYWPRWREALVLVKAETVLRWDRERGHRMRVLRRFRRIRRGGRPRIDAEIRCLISRMARDNVL
jgi:hypothetical protein